MSRQVGEEVATQGFFAWSNKQNEDAVGPRMCLTADEVGEREETSVTFIAII